MKFNYEFTPEQFDYIRKLGVKSIDNLYGKLDEQAVAIYDIFSIDLFKDVVSYKKEEIAEFEDKDKMVTYYKIKDLLTDSGIDEPNAEKTSNEYISYVDQAMAFALGIKARLNDNKAFYDSAINLSVEEYSKIKAKENKTENEEKLLAAYEELQSYNLVAPLPEDYEAKKDDELKSCLSVYSKVFSEDIDLRTDILKFENIKYADFLTSVTEKDEYLTENQKVIKEFIQNKLGLGGLNKINLISDRETYLTKVVFIATAVIDIKNGYDMSKYLNNLLADDLSTITDDKLKNHIIEVKENIDSFKKFARSNTMKSFNASENYDLSNTVTIEDYKIVNRIPEEKIISGIEDEKKREKYLKIKHELIYLYPEPKNYDKATYEEYANKVEQEYINNLQYTYVGKNIAKEKDQKAMEDAYVSDEMLEKDFAILNNKDKELVEKRQELSKKITSLKNNIEVLNKVLNKKQLTEEELNTLTTIKGRKNFDNEVELEKFCKQKISEYEEELNKLTEELNELRKENDTVKIASSFIERNIKNYEKDEEEEEVEKVEHRKDLLEKFKKFLVFGLGFGTGVALSCVPGVGTVRMVAAAAKLVNSGINLWTKKHPEGKIAKVVNAAKDKIKNKFPKMTEKLEILKGKLKRVPLNLFVNGVSAGYLVGNIVELTTGKTVFEHFKPENKVVNVTPVEPDKLSPNVNDNVDNVIENVPTAEPTFSYQPGQTLDLSSLPQGYAASGSNSAVDLITKVGKDAVFDRAVTTPSGELWYHFKQANGLGYAWFKASDIEALVEKGITR